MRELPDGFTVQFEHGRYDNDEVLDVLAIYEETGLSDEYLEARASLAVHPSGDKGYAISPTGGVTTAVILDEGGNEVATGLAQCGLMDNFDRKLGRTIALGRALKSLE